MRVTALGHAGLLVEAARARVLIDPILRETPFARGLLAIDPPRRLRLERLPRPSALVITHAHADHFDPPSLVALDRALPVLVPNDAGLRAQLAALGFRDVRVLAPGRFVELGGARIGATASLKRGADEVGVLVLGGGASLWNTADSDFDQRIARQALRGRAAIDLVAVRFQPIRRVLDGLSYGSGAGVDKRDVVRWLEAACAVQPRAVFPYGAGLRLRGRPSWLDRYLFPFDEDAIASLLTERLAPRGAGYGMRPGDVLELRRGVLRHRPQASPFVRSAERSRRSPWEPIVLETLGRKASRALRRELVDRLEAILRGPFAAWLAREIARPRGAFAGFLAWSVTWQLVVHLGSSRLCYAIDFGTRPLRLVRGAQPRANYFLHCSGEGLHRVLCRGGGAEWLLSAGDQRFCERILAVKSGVIAAPVEVGPALHARLPDPFLLYLANRELS